MKRLFAFAIASFFLLFLPNAFAHIGEQKALDYEVVYTDYWALDPNGVPQYPIGTSMHFEVHIKNIAKRTFMNLEVSGFQEYFVTPGAYDGQAMPGDNSSTWLIDELRPGDEVVLHGTYYGGWGVLAGLDKTRLIIKHGNEGKGTGSEIFNDPYSGIWCPP